MHWLALAFLTKWFSICYHHHNSWAGHCGVHCHEVPHKLHSLPLSHCTCRKWGLIDTCLQASALIAGLCFCCNFLKQINKQLLAVGNSIKCEINQNYYFQFMALPHFLSKLFFYVLLCLFDYINFLLFYTVNLVDNILIKVNDTLKNFNYYSVMDFLSSPFPGLCKKKKKRLILLQFHSCLWLKLRSVKYIKRKEGRLAGVEGVRAHSQTMLNSVTTGFSLGSWENKTYLGCRPYTDISMERDF